MIIAALVFSACQIIVCLAFCGLIRWYAERKEQKWRDEITAMVRAFVEAPDENTPSPLGILLDQGATLLASRLMQQLKAMLAGVESGLSKAESAQMLGEVAEGSPLLAILSNILPKKIRAALVKNPQMIGALSKLSNRNGGSAAETVPPRRHRE